MQRGKWSHAAEVQLQNHDTAEGGRGENRGMRVYNSSLCASGSDKVILHDAYQLLNDQVQVKGLVSEHPPFLKSLRSGPLKYHTCINALMH